MSSRRSLAPRLLATLAVVLVTGACATGTGSGETPTPDGTGSPGATGMPSATESPGATAEPVVQVAMVGGFVPVGTEFASVPQLTVYAEGRAIVHGPQIAIYPAPALPNLLEHSVVQEEVAAVLDAAREAGLLQEPPDYGRPAIADAQTTVVRLRADGETWVHRAEALGGATERLDGDTMPGLDEDQLEARRTLARFIETVRDVVGTAGEAESYDADAFAVRARAADLGIGDTGQPAEDQELVSVQPWPLPDVSLAEAQDCVLVAGQDAEVLRQTLADANRLTQLSQDGVAYEVWTRPLLPHEDGCAVITGAAPAR